MKNEPLETIIGNIRKYGKKRTLFAAMLILLLLYAMLALKLLSADITAVDIICALMLPASYGAAWVVLYRDVIRVDVRLRDARLSAAGRKDASLYEELDNFLNNFEELYEGRYQQQLLQKQALIQSLQNQINPHFLYNTLDSIRGQALEEDSREIADMLGVLSAFFRYTISSKQDKVSFEQELRNVGNYMRIQQYRFANRFTLKVDVSAIPDALMRYQLPKLTLQPLVENAINHGFSNMREGGVVTISAQATPELLTISVRDNGSGIPEDKLISINSSLSAPGQGIQDISGDAGAGSGIAVRNVNSRIRLMFGDRYGLHLFSAVGVGTTADITLPAGGCPV